MFIQSPGKSSITYGCKREDSHLNICLPWQKHWSVQQKGQAGCLPYLHQTNCEYASTAWDLHTMCNITRIEMATRWWACYVAGKHHHASSVSSLIISRKWPILEASGTKALPSTQLIQYPLMPSSGSWDVTAPRHRLVCNFFLFLFISTTSTIAPPKELCVNLPSWRWSS